MRSQLLQVGREHSIGAGETLDAHRRRQIDRRQQGTKIGDRQHQHAEHAVGAVDEREPLLLLEFDRLDARSGQRLARRHEHADGIPHLTLAEQGERAVGERREVARAAEAAVFVDDGSDPGVEQGGVGLGDDRADPGATRGERREPKQDESTHHLALHLGT